MRPLDGVRVVEAASYVTGPLAALALADLGADVIKVEPPTGDPMRRFGVRHDGLSLHFAHINRNKRSLTLDLKTSESRDALFELLDGADIFITNWRPSVAARLKLTEDFVRARFPRLIWIRVSGYGQDGPMADFPAFDGIVQARSGVVAHNGDPPRLVPGYLADKVTGLMASHAALAGLHQRATSGDGCISDVSMIDSLAYFHGPDLLAGHGRTDKPEPAVARHIAAARPLKTADGWLLVSPVSGHHIKNAVVCAGHPEWSDRLRAILDPTTMAETFFALIETVLPTRTTTEWEAAFKQADVPASAVFDYASHIHDPQVVHNRTYGLIDDPVLGQMRTVRHPALFNGEPADTNALVSPEVSDEIRQPNWRPASVWRKSADIR